MRYVTMLSRISDFLKKTPVSRLEAKRLADDLETVYFRLSHREYVMMDYSGKNKYKVPERTREFFLYLESYCLTGKTWARILRKLRVNSYDRVVDFCSGWAPKITLALFYTGYAGEVVLVDKNQKSMHQLDRFMELFYPAYSIRKERQDVMESDRERFPFLIANHVIDDIILDAYCQANRIDSGKIYEEEWAVLRLWEKIMQDERFSRDLPETFYRIFDGYLEKGGILCLSQYRSMMEGLLHLDDSVAFSVRIMHETARILTSRGYVLLQGISEAALKGFHGAFLPEECLIFQKNP